MSSLPKYIVIFTIEFVLAWAYLFVVYLNIDVLNNL